MTNKTRKHIWPVAVMSLVVAGALAVVLALYAVPQQMAQAHECDDLSGSGKSPVSILAPGAGRGPCG